jgi:hypothetical protein
LPCSLLITLRLLLHEKLVAVSNSNSSREKRNLDGMSGHRFRISLFYNYNTARSLNRRALYPKSIVCQLLKDQ